MTPRKKAVLTWSLSVGVLLVAAGAASALIATKPEPPREERPLEGALVEVIEVDSARHEVQLYAKGTVVPAEQVVLQPELSGRVVWQSSELVVGGRFKKGQPILKIDPRDYELAVEGFRSQVNRARLDLAVEGRRGEIAKREWEAFGDTQADEAQKALAQRKPHLEASKLALKAAQSALKKARLDLTRTTLRAPFNAEVLEETVDIGQLIGPRDRVARLVRTDAYHVQVSVPVASLRTIRVRNEDGPGSGVSVMQRIGQESIEREGEVIRRLADLDPGGSMARVLVRIDDPLGDREELPLLLGSYVDVAIDAKPIEKAIRVPRAALHGGRNVYVMNENDLLEIRGVGVAWSLPEALLIASGLSPGERVVISRIATPVPNMRLRQAEPKNDAQTTEPTMPAARAMQ